MPLKKFCAIFSHILSIIKVKKIASKPSGQDLGIYWDSKMANLLEQWGEGSVWNEIQFLFALRKGKVLDIACGTGSAMLKLQNDRNLNIFGCDISDLLLERAVLKGINKKNLSIQDATKMKYKSKFFDYAYSIGSLEHFTEEGIIKFLKESKRVTKIASFHNIPVSRDGDDHGWIIRTQSYFNNSTLWWLKKFRRVYRQVIVIDSSWSDQRSLGKWFICIN